MERFELEPVELRERYLGFVRSELGEVFTGEDLTECLEELRAHIDESARAFEELGHDSDAAMRMAIERMGQGKTIANEYRKEVPKHRWLRLRAGFLAVFPTLLIAFCLYWIMESLLVRFGFVHGPDVSGPIYVLIFSVVSVFFATGAKGSPKRFALWSSAPLIVLMSFFYGPQVRAIIRELYFSKYTFPQAAGPMASLVAIVASIFFLLVLVFGTARAMVIRCESFIKSLDLNQKKPRSH